mmetsp:Transcript_1981/g.3605  ORF Transcript_1981/g.3605 Transcript_1981/m.3605 type:complete len:591 (-) Transcript_1981:52-1824(-)
MTGMGMWYLILFAIHVSAGVCKDHDPQSGINKEYYKNVSPSIKADGISSAGKHIPLKFVSHKQRFVRGRYYRQQIPKIVGGNEAPAGEYPWYSALYRNRNGNETNVDFYCGGMLISPSFVLTAAHCKPNIGDVVVVGALCPYETGNCNQQVEFGSVELVFKDPRYTMEITFSLGWDYMLLQLTEPIDTIVPVDLDNGAFSSNYKPGKRLWVAGMGFTDPSNLIAASRLQEAELGYVPEDSCKDNLKPMRLGQFTICATDTARLSDVCFGDSGGPLYDKENKVLVGLTSYGDSACRSRIPGVYARVSDNFAWIQFIVCSQNPTDALCSKAVEPTTSPAPTSKWCASAELKVTLATDLFPHENAWALTELTSNTLVLQGSLSSFEQNKDHVGHFCLPIQNNECYRFDIDDSGGNGIDLNGSNMDYCLILDDEMIECNKDFEGDRDAIIFPEKNCNGVCNVTSYVLQVQTGIVFSSEEVKTSIFIRDERTGRLIFPYYFSQFKPNRSYAYPIDLCHGSYNVEVENIGNTLVTIFDTDGNIIWINGDLKTNEGVFSSGYAMILNNAGTVKSISLIVHLMVSLVGIFLIFSSIVQ